MPAPPARQHFRRNRTRWPSHRYTTRPELILSRRVGELGMHRYDNLRTPDVRDVAASATRAALYHIGTLAALTIAGCFPLEDLSRYSRGAAPPTDAGPRQFTSATREPAPNAPPDAAAPTPLWPTDGVTPGEDGDPDAPDGDSPERPSGDDPTQPEASLDAGVPAHGLPDGCIAREPDGGLGSCYAISREPLPWSEALAACEGWSGSLVSINSASESDWLAAMLDATVWIGANDRQREGTFGWANGDPFQFELFAAGQPDNTFGLQDCVERRVDSSWNDRACTVRNPFVCERPL